MSTAIREFWVGLPRWGRFSLLITSVAILFWLLSGALGLRSRTWLLAEFGPHEEALATQVETEAREMAGEVDPGAEVYLEIAVALRGELPAAPGAYRVTTNSKELYEAWVSRSPNGR